MTSRFDLKVTRRRALGTLGGVGLTMAAPGWARALTPGKKRVLIAGDSMIAGALGLYLAQTLAKERGQEVLRRGKSSTGLARPDFFDWFEEATRLVSEFKPEVSVVMFGGNDVQGLRMAKDEWIRWHEPPWKTEYARRVAEFSDIVAPKGQHLFWIGMPVMRPPKFHSRVQRINLIARAEMAIRRNSTFVDTWSVLAGKDGEYVDRLLLADGSRQRRVLVRAGDGIHLTRAGARMLSDHVLEVIDRELHHV